MPERPYRTPLFPDLEDGGESLLEQACPLAVHFIRHWHDRLIDREGPVAAHHLTGAVIERLPGSAPTGDYVQALNHPLTAARAALVRRWLQEEATPVLAKMAEELEQAHPGASNNTINDDTSDLRRHAAMMAVHRNTVGLSDLAGVASARHALWATGTEGDGSGQHGHSDRLALAAAEQVQRAADAAFALASLSLDAGEQRTIALGRLDPAVAAMKRHHRVQQLEASCRRVGESATAMLHRALDLTPAPETR